MKPTTAQNLIDALTVGGIGGVSALVAIAGTHGHLPEVYDLYTSALAALLAGLVRFATLMGYSAPKTQ